MRFDYQGTGDSSGEDESPDRVAAWTRDIVDVIDTLRGYGQVERVSLFGLRIGATLATYASAVHSCIDSLILWNPCPNGKAYIREARIQTKCCASEPPSRSHVTTAGAKASETLLGFSLSGDALEQLSRLNLFALQHLIVPSVLLISNGARANDYIADHLTAAGVAVVLQRFVGATCLDADVNYCVVREDVIDRIVAFCKERDSLSTTTPGTQPRGEGPQREALSTGQYTEEALCFGPEKQLFGVRYYTREHAIVDSIRHSVVKRGVCSSHRPTSVVCDTRPTLGCSRPSNLSA